MNPFDRIFETGKLILLSVVILFISFGCVEKELDFDSIKSQNWNSEWALPLINSDLKLEDFLNDSSNIVETGEDGLVTLVYETENLVSIEASEITDIPDQEKDISKSFDLPVLPPGVSGSIPVEFRFDFELDEEGLRIDSILLKSGTYHFSMSTDLDKDVTSIDFEVPNFINLQTGTSMQFSVLIDTEPGGGVIEKDTLIDLSNYRLVFEDVFQDTNYIYINALVNFTSDEDPYNNPYFIELNNEFLDMDFLKFFGYAGQRTITMSDSVELNVFNITEEGSFLFGEGSVNLFMELQNSFGLPTTLEVDRFMAYHNVGYSDSLEIFIFGEGNPAIIDLNYPNLNEVGEAKLTEVESDNSNMNEALSISPDLLYIEMSGYLNPEGDVSQSNFILDSSRIDAKVTVSLELYGQIDSFKVADTVDFDLTSLDEVEKILLATNVSNGFPINAAVQLTFVDSLYNIVHQLYPEDETLMWAGQVGPAPDYRVVQPTEKITETVIEGEELRQLEEARQIIINATLNTNDNQDVKIYEDYSLNLKLGVKLGIQF